MKNSILPALAGSLAAASSICRPSAVFVDRKREVLLGGQKGGAYLDCFLLKDVDKLATFSAVNFETFHPHWSGGGIRERACM
jgi:hypothetical protein